MLKHRHLTIRGVPVYFIIRGVPVYFIIRGVPVYLMREMKS